MRRPGSGSVRALQARLALASVLGLLAAGAPGPAAAVARPAQDAPAPVAFVVVDARDGEVLLGEDVHVALPPASTAKIMTALTAIERLPSDATVQVSALAAAQPASRINMVAGQQWPLRDALASLVLASANDAAYAIAETAGGSLEGFAAAMADTAERLGMRDSTFSDPAGLDDEASFGGGPRMSAFDVAIATRNALAVPEIATLAATRELEFVDPAGATRSLTNHNKMLPGGSRGYDGATGFKTGYTRRAGHTLVATAERDGCSLIVVVLGTYDTYTWAASLLDQGFSMGCAGGTGERLPAVAVWPYAERVEEQQAFAALARGPGANAPEGDAPTVGSPPTTAAAPADVGRAAPIAAGDDGDAAGETAGGAGGARLRWIGGGVVGLALVLVVLRRRAVKRRRARRLARQRARAARMRAGGLTVVDGRYRTGTRVGPPLESHVRVHRARHDR